MDTTASLSRRRALAFLRGGAICALGPVALAGCAARPAAPVRSDADPLPREVRAMYAAVEDGPFLVPAIPARHLTPENVRRVIAFPTDEPAGTIIVDPYAMYLFYVLGDGEAIRYRVGIGEAGRNFSGVARVAFKREWPRWTPTARMLSDDPALYEPWRGGMEGGLENPLGARALYLYRGGRDTRYRIHGTYAPWSIGQGISAGCIRLFNQDAMDLHDRTPDGTRVVVLGPGGIW
jgi:lipoprotein-anchoring transpeptidase ErfK/SrfK